MFSFLMTGCASTPPNKDVQAILNWKLVFNQDLPNGDLMRQYIPANESAEAWHDRFNVTFHKHDPAKPPQPLRAQAEAVCTRNSAELSAQMKKMEKPDCQVACNFINSADRSLLFEIPQACSTGSANYQLLRWISTAEGMYYFSFLQKQTITPETRRQWLSIMKSVQPAKGDHIRDYFN